MKIKRLGAAGLIIGGLLSMACGDGSAAHPVVDGIPANCEYIDAVHYQQNHFARFDSNNHRLMLVDWNTGDDIFELDTDISAQKTLVLDWSPTCRYLVTQQDSTGVIYDTIDGRKLGTFEKLRGYSRREPSVVFDQSDTYVTVEANSTTYLHNLNSGSIATLSDDYFRVQYWDYERNQLIGIADDEVAIYDLNSGTKVVSLGDIGLTSRPGMIFSPDHTMLAFHSENRLATVINRDTLARVDIHIGFYSYTNEHVMAISPDNRWLTVGDNRVNVWDLQNPPENLGARTPTAFNFSGPGESITDIHFLDNNIIETITYADTDPLYWNMVTGEQVVR